MAALMLIPLLFAADKQKDEETLRNANLVLQDMLNGNTISPKLLPQAKCVLILPGVKQFGFGVGGSGGRGRMLCRNGQHFDGKWSSPAMFWLGGASIGLQVGGSSTDFVLLLMNPKVVNQILTGKTKMGSDATAAAGPGATAASASDVDILTYGRAKGAFAGVSSEAQPWNRTMTRITAFMARRLPPPTSFAEVKSNLKARVSHS